MKPAAVGRWIAGLGDGPVTWVLIGLAVLTLGVALFAPAVVKIAYAVVLIA